MNELDARISALEMALAAEVPRMRRWWWTWIGVYGGLAAVSVAGALVNDDPARRAESTLNAAGTTLGGLALLLRPPPAADTAARLRGMPTDTEAQRRARAEEVYRLTRNAAAWEGQLAGWMTTVAGVVVAVGLALPLWLEYDRPDRAGVNIFAGLVINQLQIYTQPKALVDLGAVQAVSAPATGGLVLVPSPGGISLGGRF